MSDIMFYAIFGTCGMLVFLVFLLLLVSNAEAGQRHSRKHRM